MIEEIVDGIWEDVGGRVWMKTRSDKEEIKHRWRIIIRKAIADNQGNMDIDTLTKMDTGCGDKLSHSSSQAMLEETAVMDR